MDALHFSQLGLALLEGLGLILSPCILPILPIMLAASLDGGKARPLGIITGFIGAFTLFELLSRQILAWLNVDPEIVRDVALGLLVLFGLGDAVRGRSPTNCWALLRGLPISGRTSLRAGIRRMVI